MKTKYLLTAMLLPAAFAACTNEDVLVENPNVLEDRPVVDFKVAATYGAEGTESRMENKNGTFLWENTDVLGAVWNQTGNIYSNNKFVNTLTEANASADFTTQATTVVGDYVFYYPYNTDVTKDLASGIVYSLPEPQEYDPTGDKMMNNNFMISPNITVDGNEPGELTLPLTMRSIYGYGTLNFKLAPALIAANANVSSLNIQKIIITYVSNVKKDGSIDFAHIPVVNLSAEHIADLIADDEDYNQDATLTDDEEEALVGKTEAEVKAAIFKAADRLLVASADNYSDGEILDLTGATTTFDGNGTEVENITSTDAITQVSIACVTSENPNGVALAQGQTFSTRVLLPTTGNTGTSVNILVYTDKGLFTIPTITNARIKANHTANLANVNRAVNVDEAFTLTTAMWSSVGSVYAINEADFIATVKTLKANTNISVGDFSLTPAAIAAIPSTVKITFTSDVTFEGDMTLKNMTFNGDVNLKSGKIVLGTGLTFNGDINVNGADATIVTSFESGTPDVAVNSGSMDIAAVNKDGEAVATTLAVVTVGSVDQKGKPVAATFKVTNNLTATSVTVKAESTLDNAAIINTLTVEADAIANNAGTIATLAANDGTLNNAGIISAGTNNKIINQETGGKIIALTNSLGAVINTEDNTETKVTTNRGEVIYKAGARVKVDAGTGNVNYIAPSTFAMANFASLNSAVTKVTFNENFAITDDFSLVTANENIKALEFKKNLSVTSNKIFTLNSGTTLLFTGVESTISGGTITGAARMIVGVADSDPTDEIDDSVNTDVEILKGTSLSTIDNVEFKTEKSQVWNEGTVTGSLTQTGNGANYGWR